MFLVLLIAGAGDKLSCRTLLPLSAIHQDCRMGCMVITFQLIQGYNGIDNYYLNKKRGSRKINPIIESVRAEQRVMQRGT